jgi:ribosomal protein S27AE
MIAALAITILLLLEFARRGLEPECPNCGEKHWTAHSTQLHCTRCGWSNVAPAIKAEPAQYEFGLTA